MTRPDKELAKNWLKNNGVHPISLPQTTRERFMLDYWKAVFYDEGYEAGRRSLQNELKQLLDIKEQE